MGFIIVLFFTRVQSYKNMSFLKFLNKTTFFLSASILIQFNCFFCVYFFITYFSKLIFIMFVYNFGFFFEKYVMKKKTWNIYKNKMSHVLMLAPPSPGILRAAPPWHACHAPRGVCHCLAPSWQPLPPTEPTDFYTTGRPIYSLPQTLFFLDDREGFQQQNYVNWFSYKLNKLY